MNIISKEFLNNLTINQKLELVIKCEIQSGNNYKWLRFASDKDINDLFDYWFQEVI